MATKDNSKSHDVVYQNNLPILHIDGAVISVRKDGVCFLNLITETPKGAVEQGRFMINEDDLNIVIDSLCSSTEHYPQQPKQAKNKRNTKTQ
jgi:hypothetical protein